MSHADLHHCSAAEDWRHRSDASAPCSHGGAAPCATTELDTRVTAGPKRAPRHPRHATNGLLTATTALHSAGCCPGRRHVTNLAVRPYCTPGLSIALSVVVLCCRHKWHIVCYNAYAYYFQHFALNVPGPHYAHVTQPRAHDVTGCNWLPLQLAKRGEEQPACRANWREQPALLLHGPKDCARCTPAPTLAGRSLGATTPHTAAVSAATLRSAGAADASRREQTPRTDLPTGPHLTPRLTAADNPWGTQDGTCPQARQPSLSHRGARKRRARQLTASGLTRLPPQTTLGLSRACTQLASADALAHTGAALHLGQPAALRNNACPWPHTGEVPRTRQSTGLGKTRRLNPGQGRPDASQGLARARSHSTH